MHVSSCSQLCSSLDWCDVTDVTQNQFWKFPSQHFHCWCFYHIWGQCCFLSVTLIHHNPLTDCVRFWKNCDLSCKTLWMCSVIHPNLFVSHGNYLCVHAGMSLKPMSWSTRSSALPTRSQMAFLTWSLRKQDCYRKTQIHQPHLHKSRSFFS